MTISAANRASVFSGTNLSSYSTGSWTPAANRLAIVSVENELSGVPNTPTLSGNGITWSQLVTYLPDSTGTQVRITVFVGKTGASPTAGAVTADFGGIVQAGCNVIVDEIDQADVSGTALQAIVQSKTGTVNGSGTSESITLNSAITSVNASYGVFNHQADETTTNGSGYTTLGNGSHAGPSSALQTEYKVAGSQTVDASWVTSAGKGGVALEIKAAGGPVAGQTTEIDTSQAVGKIKSKAIGQDLEADTPLAIGAQRARALLQTIETNIAQAIAARKIRAVSQIVEADSSQAIAAQRRVAAAQIAETDTTQAVAYHKSLTVGLNAETDSAHAFAVRKVVSVFQAEETNAGQASAVQRIVQINQASESDTTQTIARQKRIVLLQTSEVDIAQPVSTVGAIVIQPVEETDLAQSLFPRKRLAIVQVVEVELAQPVAPGKIMAISLITEINLAQALIAGTGPGRSSHVYQTEDHMDYQTERSRHDKTQVREVHRL